MKSSQEMIRRQGFSHFNVRAVAADLGISVGALYNYFGSKSELLYETMESICREIFPEAPPEDVQNTVAYLAWLFSRIAYGSSQYPGLISCHASLFTDEAKRTGRRKMGGICAEMVKRIGAVLERDPNLRADAFHDGFTPEKFAETLFSLLVSAAVRNDDDPSVVLEIVRRTLY